jgi:hypothetical protein
MPSIAMVTVRLWGNGVTERGRVLGAEVSGRRFRARSGQFIASRIDARNGAMGLVPESLEGAIVTHDFPLFDLDRTRLEPAFLGWLCRTGGFVDLCRRASEGTTDRVRLKEAEFTDRNFDPGGNNAGLRPQEPLIQPGAAYHRRCLRGSETAPARQWQPWRNRPAA